MEVITLHVGQAGVSAAGSLWQLYCLDHGLKPDGTVCDMDNSRGLGFRSFFRDSTTKASPLAILTDLDNTSIDGTLVGMGKMLFSRNNTASGLEDSGSNFAIARYGKNSKMTTIDTMEKLRLMSEGTSSLQGFIVQHALGGGTGSGFTCNLLDKMYYAYPKKPIVQFAIYPSSKYSMSVLEPYNTILGTAATKPSHKCCCLVSNGAMYTTLQRNGVTVRPDYKDLNVLWNYAISTVTSNMRLGGELRSNLSEILTNMVPYPQMRFPFISYAPVKAGDSDNNVKNIVKTCFEPISQLLNCNIKKGFYMAASLSLRGPTSPQVVSDTLTTIRVPNNIKFAKWCPNGFKIGTCPKSSPILPGSVLTPGSVSACALNASTSVSQVWKDILRDFNVMLRKKAFLHWYLFDGMEESEFHNAANDIVDLISHYETMGS